MKVYPPTCERKGCPFMKADQLAPMVSRNAAKVTEAAQKKSPWPPGAVICEQCGAARKVVE